MQPLVELSEPELIRKYCQPSHHVILFGANASMRHDASAAFVGTLLDKKAGGRITLVDAQAYSWSERANGKEVPLMRLLKTKGIDPQRYDAIRARAGGQGGAASHRKSIRDFNKKHGLQVIVPEIWLADASKTGLPERSSDLSINRMAFVQMIENNADTNLNALIREHLRPLRVGGHALFLFQSGLEADKIRNRLGAMGLSFQEYALEKGHYQIGPEKFMANCTRAIVVQKST